VSDQIVRQNGTNPTDKIIIIKKNKIANQNENNFIIRSSRGVFKPHPHTVAIRVYRMGFFYVRKQFRISEMIREQTPILRGNFRKEPPGCKEQKNGKTFSLKNIFLCL